MVFFPTCLSERQLHLVWRLGLFRRQGLLLEDGRPLSVFFPGHAAVEGGPDFREARLRIADRDVCGDIELHLMPSGWRHHRHERDSAYAGVVLHVSLRRDPFPGSSRPIGGGIPELVLEPYLEVSVAELAELTGGRRAGIAAEDGGGILPRLERWGRLRFERRRKALGRIALLVGADEAVYREAMTALGYKRNKAPFAELARLVPWRSVRGEDRAPLESLYAAAGACLPWRDRCGRPSNHPRRRLSGWCALLPRCGGSLLSLTAEDIVRWSEGRIGFERAWDLQANVIFPARGDARLLERLRPPAVSRPVRDACAALGVDPSRLASLWHHWGALEWHRNELAPAMGDC
ncbi:MAG: DUF2851 family protein [Planctomycetes bacterium]|nr:DUF2851 family protein [Planctomycetota bacterium]